MGWARFDDGYMMHPKILEAGPWAELLDRRAIEWCAKNETDGLVTRSSLKLLGRGIPRVAERVHTLLEVGRWTLNDGGGWWVHDFLEFNPSKAQKQQIRDQGRLRQQRHRNAGSNGVTDGVSNSELHRGGAGNNEERRRVPLIERCTRCGQLEFDCECPRLEAVR